MMEERMKEVIAILKHTAEMLDELRARHETASRGWKGDEVPGG